MSESGIPGGSSVGAHGAPVANTSLALLGDYGCSDSDSADEHGMETSAGEGELSEMVLKNNIINACAHGPLSDGSSAGEARQIVIDSSGNGVIEYSVTYREQDSDESASDSDSEVDSVRGAEEVDSSLSDDDTPSQVPTSTPKVRGELTLDDLPPIEELNISVPAAECTQVGKVFNIVDKLVIVQALPNTPAVDLDSVLFLENGQRALGKVFDVFGPVSEPHYCVRFNSTEQIREKKIELGAEVYVAPRTDHTSFVFVSQLMRMKGSDASWLNDLEPPPTQLEFSDDEEERRAKKERKQRHQQTDAEGQGQERRPKPTRFEEQMNRRNLQRSAESRPHSSQRVHNPFARPPPPAQPPPQPWGGPFQPWPQDPCSPAGPMFGRPWFNPYSAPPPVHVNPAAPFTPVCFPARPPFARPFLRPSRMQYNPYDPPPPPPPNT